MRFVRRLFMQGRGKVYDYIAKEYDPPYAIHRLTYAVFVIELGLRNFFVQRSVFRNDSCLAAQRLRAHLSRVSSSVI